MEEFVVGWFSGILTAFIAYAAWAFNWFDGP